MRATAIWGTGRGATASFELCPARSEKAAKNLNRAIDGLAALSPDFVSVTFGAGGSTREGSRQLIDKLRNDKGLEVIACFAGYGPGPDEITEVLHGYRRMGVENIAEFIVANYFYDNQLFFDFAERCRGCISTRWTRAGPGWPLSSA